MTLSAGTLCYVFADRIAPVVAGRAAHVVAPGGNPETRVDLRAVAVLVAAVTLWDMREQGLLSLTLAPEQPSGGTRRIDVAIRPGPGQQTAQEQVTVVAIAMDAVTVDAVLSAWVTDRETPVSPYAQIVGLARKDLVAHGLARQDDREVTLVSLFSKADGFEPDRGQLRQLEDDFGRRWTGWLDFHRNEPELAGALVTTATEVLDGFERARAERRRLFGGDGSAVTAATGRATALSTATLCLLFADQLEGYQPYPTGDEVPASGARFARRWWVRVSVAMTIHRLRGQRVLDLDLGTGNGRRRQGVRTVTTSVVARPLSLPPLDDNLLAAMGSRVHSDVHSTMSSMPDPWIENGYSGWYKVATAEAIAANLARWRPREPRRIWESREVLVWDREAVLRHWDAFWPVGEGWRRFRAEEPELSLQLIDDIQAGLEELNSRSS